MTIVERNKKLKHFITCLKCEVSGKCCDDNCSTQYEVGNMGEIIENLEAISKALEQEPCEDVVSREAILLQIDKIKDNYGGLLDVARFVRDLPSVNPQPKTGHWIRMSDMSEQERWLKGLD